MYEWTCLHCGKTQVSPKTDAVCASPGCGFQATLEWPARTIQTSDGRLTTITAKYETERK